MLLASRHASGHAGRLHCGRSWTTCLARDAASMLAPSHSRRTPSHPNTASTTNCQPDQPSFPPPAVLKYFIAQREKEIESGAAKKAFQKAANQGVGRAAGAKAPEAGEGVRVLEGLAASGLRAIRWVAVGCGAGSQVVDGLWGRLGSGRLGRVLLLAPACADCFSCPAAGACDLPLSAGCSASSALLLHPLFCSYDKELEGVLDIATACVGSPVLAVYISHPAATPLVMQLRQGGGGCARSGGQ